MIHAFGYLKRACAEVNREHYGLDATIADAIVTAASEVRIYMYKDWSSFRKNQSGVEAKTFAEATQIQRFNTNNLG